MQSKKTFNLGKIVKKFSLNLKKTDGKSRELLWRQLEKKIEENLKDGEANYRTIKKANFTKNLRNMKIFEKRLRKIISEKFKRSL